MDKEIAEALQFDPFRKRRTEADQNEIEEALKFDPFRKQSEEGTGGTYDFAYQPDVVKTPDGAQGISTVSGGVRAQYNTADEPSAGFGTMMETSFVDSPAAKAKIFSKARGIPIERYRIRSGEVEFKNDKGRWQREISDLPTDQLKNIGASVVADPRTYLGTAGAIGAGTAGAVLGTMAGGGIRKDIGRLVYGDEDQGVLSNMVDMAMDGILALGGEMAGKVLSGGINKYLGGSAVRTMKGAGKEISRGLLSPEDHAQALVIQRLAEQHGIKLGPHQLYDRTGMTNAWKYLRQHPQTSDAIQKIERAMAGQVEDAMTVFIKKMQGGLDTPFELGTKLKGAAENAISKAETIRANKARPFYEKAFEPKQVIDTETLQKQRDFISSAIRELERKITPEPDLNAMVAELKRRDIPAMKQYRETDSDFLDRIASDYKRITKKEIPMTEKVAKESASKIEDLIKQRDIIDNAMAGMPPAGFQTPTKLFKVDVSDAIAEVDRLMGETVEGDPSYAALKRIKRMLDAADGNPRKLDRVKRSGIDNVLSKTQTNKTLSRELKIVKDQLTAAMDNQVPGYAKARLVYSEASEPVDRLKESIIGQLANLEGDKAISQATRRLFSTTNMPDHTLVREARQIIAGQDPVLWQKAVGGYIRDTFQELIVTEEGRVANAAGKLYKRLFGSKNQRRLMQEAFGGEDAPSYKAFENLMTVFQRAAIGTGKESMTAPFQEIGKSMQSRLYQFAKETKNGVVDLALGRWNEMILRGNEEILLESLTRPDVVKQLQSIKRLSPGSRRFIEGFGVLTAIVADHVGQSTIRTSRTPEVQTTLRQ